MASISCFLEGKLKLKVNLDKSRVLKATECEFLGFTFKGKRIRWTSKSEHRFKKEVRRLTKRSWGISMKKRMVLLAEYIRGWMGYYRLSEYYRPVPLLDHWIRRRIRCCFLKQWRKPKTRYNNLIRLGVDAINARRIRVSSKGYYRLARTSGVQQGLTDRYLESLGLVSLKDSWVAFHHPR